ncbi:tRNA synthetases class I (M)-domain-containing protein [Cyathus striatus]|nr:tRNA synthetases class I (M)-domain-containing protein [Cyathus striatus]
MIKEGKRERERRWEKEREQPTTPNIPEEKPYYITTPIFYPNSSPHVGHLHTLITADILARYQRIRHPHRPVHFLTGTDEHGLKIQKAARAKGIPEKEFCDVLSQQFRQLADRANVSRTIFMRTTDPNHYKTVQHVWRELASQDLIYKGSYAGWYSVTDECFYTPSQISQPDPSSDLSSSSPIAIETGNPVEWCEEENYMFRLSSFRDRLLDYYKGNPRAIFPPIYRDKLIEELEGGLADLSVSRPRSRLGWGVPVPGDETQTVYVWFDALLIYLSGIKYPFSPFEAEKHGWPVDVQVIGKDILKFHALHLPSFLLALGLPLQRKLYAHAHWTVAQKKMSKSWGNVADPFAAMDRKEGGGVDAVRWYIARVGGRARENVDWNHDELNKFFRELMSLMGNLYLRVTSPKISDIALSQSAMHGSTTLDNADYATYTDAELHPEIKVIREVTDMLPGKVIHLLDNFEIADAAEELGNVLRQANKSFTCLEPWSPSCPPSLVRATYFSMLDALHVVGTCMQPFIPESAERLLDAMGVPTESRSLQLMMDAKQRYTWGIVHERIKLF